MTDRCQYIGPVGENRDDANHCLNDAERQTDARALGKPEDALDLCAEHREVVKAYFLAQAERA
jgi:hypothetical protein